MNVLDFRCIPWSMAQPSTFSGGGLLGKGCNGKGDPNFFDCFKNRFRELLKKSMVSVSSAIVKSRNQSKFNLFDWRFCLL